MSNDNEDLSFVSLVELKFCVVFDGLCVVFDGGAPEIFGGLKLISWPFNVI